jgi:hypothetical protein
MSTKVAGVEMGPSSGPSSVSEALPIHIKKD